MTFENFVDNRQSQLQFPFSKTVGHILSAPDDFPYRDFSHWKILMESRRSSNHYSRTKTGEFDIFMAIYGIPEIFMDDNNQYEYPKKKY